MKPLLPHSSNILSYEQCVLRLWMQRVMPLFILFSNLANALQSVLQLRMETRRIVFDAEWIGIIYKLYDLTIVLCGSGLIVSGRNNLVGVGLLLLQRILQRIVLGIWSCDQMLSDFVDVGCLLLLLVHQLNRKEEWQQKKHCLLLLSRLCLSCLLLLWYREAQSVINDWFAIFCWLWIVFGFCCKSVSYLIICAILFRTCTLPNWNYMFGWHDATVSVWLMSSLVGRLGGFLLLGRYGAGKWSLDARWAK